MWALSVVTHQRRPDYRRQQHQTEVGLLELHLTESFLQAFSSHAYSMEQNQLRSYPAMRVMLSSIVDRTAV